MHFIPGIVTFAVLFGFMIDISIKGHTSIMVGIYLATSIAGYVTVKKRVFHQYNTKFPSDPGMALFAFAVAWPYAVIYYFSVWYGILLGTIKKADTTTGIVKKRKR